MVRIHPRQPFMETEPTRRRRPLLTGWSGQPLGHRVSLSPPFMERFAAAGVAPVSKTGNGGNSMGFDSSTFRHFTGAESDGQIGSCNLS